MNVSEILTAQRTGEKLEENRIEWNQIERERI